MVVKLYKKKSKQSELKNHLKVGWKLYGNQNNLILGKHVSFGGNVIIHANEKIEIGDATMIATNTIIHTSTHNYFEHPMWTHRVDRPIKIGKHVWIGASAIILPGVIIEDYCVIGAGSVINKNVPKGAIVMGNPARIINYRDLKNIDLCVDINPNQARIQKGVFKKSFIQ